MFSLFKKVSPSDEKAAEFALWFVSIVDDLEKTYIEGNGMKYLDEVELHLASAYSEGYTGNVEFQYGYDPDADRFELFLFHLNKKFLIEATAKIKAQLEPRISARWNIYCES